MQDAASSKAGGLLRILLVWVDALSTRATAKELPMKSRISATAILLSFASTFTPSDVYARMMGASMGGAGMMEGMMWLMAIFWLLIAVVLILAIAALVKYLFRK